jgi:predicted NBD/HSP70 family sugar kinase
MRSINQTAVFEFIRMNKKASRAVIASELDISLPSVVRIIDDLFDRGFLRFSGETEDSGGRRRPLIELNSGRNYSIGMVLRADGIDACLLDYTGRPVKSKSGRFFLGDTAKSLESIYAVAAGMLKTARSMGGFFRGLSVAVPGIVNHLTGEVEAAPNIRWESVPLRAFLEKKYNIPVIVENDARLATLGEMWFGFGQQCFNMAVFEIDMGLGAGLIVDGLIYRGANDSAGEIGRLVFDKKNFSTEDALFGPVELDIAGVGLLRKIRAARGPEISGAGDMELLEMLYNAYYGGEKWARPIVRTFVDSLAMSIVAADSIIDPEIIVIRGCVAGLAAGLFDEIKKKVGRKIRIEISQINNAEMLGGAVNLIYRELDYCCLRSMH